MKVYQILILILIAIIFSIVAVKIVEIEPRKEIVKEETEYRFLPIQKWQNEAVVYDIETGVQYLVMNGSMTILVDKNGKPLLYEGE